MLELAVVVVLICLNGIFALSELAVVSSRKVRLRTMAANGRRGAGAALALANSPGRLLSTTQIGITLIGILAGAVSGAALGADVSAFFADLGLRQSLAGPLGYGLVMEVAPEMTGGGSSAAGFGRDGKPDFWIGTSDHEARVHVAVAAADRAAVRAFYEAALAAGARDNGAPGLRPQYHRTITAPSCWIPTRGRGCSAERW